MTYIFNKSTTPGTNVYYIIAPESGLMSVADKYIFSLAGVPVYTKDGDVRPVSIPAVKPTVSFDDLYGGHGNDCC
nr:MAG TPA: hypothetical protein [Caudoviricetes sp.]